jgi:hypothetical protein
MPDERSRAEWTRDMGNPRNGSDLTSGRLLSVRINLVEPDLDPTQLDSVRVVRPLNCAAGIGPPL